MIKLLKNIDTITNTLFNIQLYNYQKEILNAIFSNQRKITIKATTRAGKSYTLALSLLLYILCFPKTKIGIIAPTQHKTKIIYSYIADFLAQCPELADKFDIKVPKDDISRLRAEASKQKLTTKQGGYIEVLTADLPSGGQALMGRAYDLTAIDESAELSQESWSKVYRMLVENPKSKIVEIYNPWFLNHTYEHWHDDTWVKIHIPWTKCVNEGRMTKEAVEDQRKNLTELEFQVLFNANFPKDIENSIFTEDQHIIPACRVKEFSEYDKILIGIDTAQGGKDNTVITTILELDNEYSFYNSIKMDNKDDMSIVGMFLEYIEKEGFNKEDIEISVDYPMGKGVADRLKEHGFTTYEFRSGFSARNKKRFLNFKAESVFGLADIMKENRFYNLPKNSQYTLQLKKWIFDIRSDRLIHVIDPTDKSPDEADSLNIALSRPKGALTSFNLDTL